MASAMSSLHISKVAVGCGSVEALRRRQESRRQGAMVPITTRFRPKRAGELIGGSIYWIVRHRVVVRQTILGFAESEADRRTIIRLDPELVAVRPCPRRAHQGWRYLAGTDVPPDLAAGDGIAELPPAMVRELVGLALV